MAKMTICKTCGKEVALSAAVCPSCGARLKMGIGMKILIGLGSLIILVGIILANSRNDTSSTTATTSSTSSKVQLAEESIDQFKVECQQIGYEDLARDPNKHIGNKVKFTGKVVQVAESGKDVGLRVNVTKNQYDNYDDTIWVDYKKASENESRILENDIINIWGTVKGLKKYNSVMGTEVDNYNKKF